VNKQKTFNTSNGVNWQGEKRPDTRRSCQLVVRCGISWVSRNTAPRAPRIPRAPRWNIVKTPRRWCLGFNWISSKISRKRWIGEGEELTKGRNVQLLAVQVYSQCGARGAVFRDIGISWHRTSIYIHKCYLRRPLQACPASNASEHWYVSDASSDLDPTNSISQLHNYSVQTGV